VKKKYQIGLIVGRFQPFHKGHLYLIKKTLFFVDKLIIGIGSANIENEDNPFSCKEREKILKAVIKHEKIEERIKNIVPLDDYMNDDLWRDKTLAVVGSFDVIVGNNEWVNRIFEKAGYPILRLGFYRRSIYEGKKIRLMMKKHTNWFTRIPKYLSAFFAGLTR